MAALNITRLYLVEKLVWQSGGGVHYPGEGAEPLRAFLDAGRAEEYCRQHEEAAWKGLNPFTCGTKLAERTSLDGGRLRDWMLDIGLEPPAGKFNGAQWRQWFARVQATLTPVQKFKVREGLDRVHFFRVVEVNE